MLQKIRSIFDLDSLKSELKDVEDKLQTPEVWANQKLASELGQKSRELKENIENANMWQQIIDDAQIAYEMCDEELISEAQDNLVKLEKMLDKFDFQKMLSDEYISVSELNIYIKSYLENNYFLNDVYVKGEISNFKLHQSGTLYFVIKDEKSCVNVVMFKSYAMRLKVNLKMQVSIYFVKII